ncbi:MAG: amidohydrolase family protein, partial [Chloroflexota bacterium]|nr:amidohydrolase family protein [Chloroflexota bacterium]
SPQHAGAHNPDFLRPRVDPSGDGLLRGKAGSSVRLMTLAPELEHALPAIRDLRARGVVVGIGHTAASYEQALAAFDAGATYGTHFFNAMPPLHHRAPGALGALLADERVTIGLIADGLHVHPSIFAWLIKAKGVAHITLVTDAMAGAGVGVGEYHLGEQRVRVDKTSARLADGTLAGSLLTMDQAIRNLVAWRVCSLADALTLASTTPARVLNLNHLGRIAVGCAADLVMLDENLRVRQTLVGGEE